MGLNELHDVGDSGGLGVVELLDHAALMEQNDGGQSDDAKVCVQTGVFQCI